MLAAGDEMKGADAGWEDRILWERPYDFSDNALAHGDEHRAQQEYRGQQGDEPQPPVEAKHRQAH